MCNASWQMLARGAWQGGYTLVVTVQRGDLQGCSGGGGDVCLDHGSSIASCPAKGAPFEPHSASPLTLCQLKAGLLQTGW